MVWDKVLILHYSWETRSGEVWWLSQPCSRLPAPISPSVTPNMMVAGWRCQTSQTGFALTQLEAKWQMQISRWPGHQILAYADQNDIDDQCCWNYHIIRFSLCALLQYWDALAACPASDGKQRLNKSLRPSFYLFVSYNHYMKVYMLQWETASVVVL